MQLLRPQATSCSILLVLAVTSCTAEYAEPAPRPRATPWDIALAPAPAVDGSALSQRIERLQQRCREAKDPRPWLERLGRAFVVQARQRSDAGGFELARQCALAIEARHPGAPGALLLRGHVLHQEHRFAEAEQVARQLVAARGTFLDSGLLGDVLLDLGQLDAAHACYQRMLDEKPCLQSYARAAQIRWRIGDRTGARELLDLAIAAGSPRDAEALAWVCTDRARIDIEDGRLEDADAHVARALRYATAYPPALLAKGRICMARGRMRDAVPLLQRAVDQRPEPAYQWALRDAIHALGDRQATHAVEGLLEQRGAQEDARTYALYLATCGPTDRAVQAVQLARAELTHRQDAYSHDALAWALHAAGDSTAAAERMRLALHSGVDCPRLLLHAGVIAATNGNRPEATRWLAAARSRRTALLPSECRVLDRALRQL